MAERRTGVTVVENTDVVSSPPMTVEQRRKWQDVEYGIFEAAGPIPTPNGSALAYAEGGQVPVSNVLEHDYDKKGLVRYQDGWEEKVAAFEELRAHAAADRKGWGPHKAALDEFAAMLPEPAKPAKKTAPTSSTQGV